jgi:hypothetical protein
MIATVASYADWHRRGRGPNLCDRALEAARAAAPHLTPLAQFLFTHAPRRMRASSNIRAAGDGNRASRDMAMSRAATMPWVSFDNPDFCNVIAIDIDHADGLESAEALSAAYALPRPTLIIDPWSGRSHALWRLARPVYCGDRASLGPVRLLRWVRAMLANALRGTPMPHGALVKNPSGRLDNMEGGAPIRRTPEPSSPLWDAHVAAGTGLAWHTIPGDLRAVELQEIAAALGDDYGAAASGTPRWRSRNRGEPSAEGRNCRLFDLTRWWTYDRVERPTAR